MIARAKRKAKKPKAKLLAKAGKTGAAHLEIGSQQTVAIWNLSVLIVPDEQFWFAQALEIDYAAQGNTIEEAQRNFQDGLLLTIKQHLKTYGNIEKILKFASSKVLVEAAQNKANIQQFAQVSFHEILEKQIPALPFDGIDYRVLNRAA